MHSAQDLSFGVSFLVQAPPPAEQGGRSEGEPPAQPWQRGVGAGVQGRRWHKALKTTVMASGVSLKTLWGHSEESGVF